MPEGIRDTFIALMANPTREAYLALVGLIAEHPAYNPYSQSIGQLADLAAQEKFTELLERAREHLPDLLLSPRFHHLLAFAHHKLGDTQAAGTEFSIGRRCLEAIAASGDGSDARPYVVLRVEDEYDVLESLRKELKLQSTGSREGVEYDWLHCTDGTVLSFDITTPRRWLERRMEG